MPTSSYLSNNDYNVNAFRPFELDYSSVLQEAATKQSYWLQGVSKIQQGWKAINDLDPLYTQNKETLTKFNESAKEQISKLSKTDLSIADNANQIKDIIKPLYDTTNPMSKSILTDSELNKFYKGEFAKVDQYKIKNKGEEYSQVNEAYLHAKYNDYASGADMNDPNIADHLEEKWKTKTGYVPYYNYQNDIQEGLKNCKDNSRTDTNPTGKGYMETSSYSGRTAEQMSQCISASLSPKALNQIGIEGYVHYGKNYGALQTDLLDNITRDQTSNTKNIATLQARLADKTISAQEKESINKTISALSDQNGQLNEQFTKFQDINHIQNNYDNLSNYSYYGKTMSTLGKAYEHQSESHIYKEDAFDLLKYKTANDNAQSYLQKQHEIAMDQNDKIFTAQQNALNRETTLKAAGIRGKGKGTGSDNSVIDPTDITVMNSTEQPTERTPEMFYQEGKSLLDSHASLQSQILDYAKSTGLIKENQVTDPTTFIGVLQQNAKNDPMLSGLLQQYKSNEMLMNLHNTEQGRLDVEKNKRFAELDKTPVTLKLDNGQEIKLKPSQMRQYLISKSGPVQAYQSNPTTGIPMSSNSSQDFSLYYRDPNGNEYRIKNGADINKVYDKIKTITNDIFKSKLVPNYKVMSLSSRNMEDDDPVRQRFADQFSNILDDKGKSVIEYKDVRLLDTDLKGKVMVSLPGISFKEVQKRYPTAKNLSSEEDGRFIIDDPKFNLMNDPAGLNMVMSTNLENIKQDVMTNSGKYGPQITEIPILANYHGYDVYTSPISSQSGTVYIKNLKDGTVVPCANISIALDQLQNLSSVKNASIK